MLTSPFLIQSDSFPTEERILDAFLHIPHPQSPELKMDYLGADLLTPPEAAVELHPQTDAHNPVSPGIEANQAGHHGGPKVLQHHSPRVLITRDHLWARKWGGWMGRKGSKSNLNPNQICCSLAQPTVATKGDTESQYCGVQPGICKTMVCSRDL